MNQAASCDNIVIFPEGKGWRKRDVGVKVNTSALNSGAQIHGLITVPIQSSPNQFFIVSGTKIYTNQAGSQTYTDRTGTVTLGLNAPSCLYTLFPFGSNVIGFGGQQSAGGDTPWEIAQNGSSNAQVLTGTPPAAYGGFTVNNRVFAFNTSLFPNRLYWSVLSNENDWTGTGSGTSDIGANTNEPITAAAILDTNNVLIFTKSRTFRLITTSAPFPVYTLFDNTGCCGKNAVVNVDGTIYWIDSKKRMHSTTGQSVTDYPPAADDLWNGMSSSMHMTNGFRQKGSDYDWVVFCIDTAGSGTTMAIVWDLLNKCWLQNTTGYQFKCATTDRTTGITYTGTTAGFIIQTGSASTGTDTADSTSPVPYWRSGWIQPASSEEIIQVKRLTLSCKPTNGTVNLKYGFNFLADTVTTTITATAVSTETIKIVRTELTGRGNVFQYYVGLSSDATNTISVSNILLSGKVYGQKRISA